MQLYFATVNGADITWGITTRLLDGIVATPSVIAAEFPAANPREIVHELLAEAHPVRHFVSVPSLEVETIIREGKELHRRHEGVLLAVPLIEDTLPAFAALAADGVPIAATLVHSVAQGVLATKLGSRQIVLAVDAMEATGEHAADVVRDLRGIFSRNAVECDIVVAGPPNAARFGELAAAGADAAVVTPDAVRSLLQHPLTDRGVDRFLGDVSRRARPRRSR